MNFIYCFYSLLILTSSLTNKKVTIFSIFQRYSPLHLFPNYQHFLPSQSSTLSSHPSLPNCPHLPSQFSSFFRSFTSHPSHPNHHHPLLCPSSSYFSLMFPSPLLPLLHSGSIFFYPFWQSLDLAWILIVFFPFVLSVTLFHPRRHFSHFSFPCDAFLTAFR